MIPDPFIRERDGADALVEGFYLIRRDRIQRVALPVRIWFGPPLDEDGEEMDRSPRWQLHVCGMLIEEPQWLGGISIDELVDIWPRCGTEPIDADEYYSRLERAAWAAAHDPNDPFGTPGGKIDPMTAPLPFLE